MCFCAKTAEYGRIRRGICPLERGLGDKSAYSASRTRSRRGASVVTTSLRSGVAPVATPASEASAGRVSSGAKQDARRRVQRAAGGGRGAWHAVFPSLPPLCAALPGLPGPLCAALPGLPGPNGAPLPGSDGSAPGRSPLCSPSLLARCRGSLAPAAAQAAAAAVQSPEGCISIATGPTVAPAASIGLLSAAEDRALTQRRYGSPGV